MTEELEKEAEEKGREWQRSILPKSEEDYVPYAPYYPYSKGYFAGAEPREKRIAELETQIENLVYLHKEDVNTIKLLNKQIEKMKCCYNCAGYYTEQCSGCEDYSNWELRR